MSTLKQTVVEYANVIQKSKGTSNTDNLKKLFPDSPIHKGELSDAERVEFYQSEVLDAEGVAGYGVNNFSMNFENGVPNLDDVETGGNGLPASPFAPNLTSPGPGSANANDQKEMDQEIRNIDAISNFGTGLGGLVSPSKTTKNIASMKIGSYISGRSFQGSDGKN